MSTDRRGLLILFQKCSHASRGRQKYWIRNFVAAAPPSVHDMTCEFLGRFPGESGIVAPGMSCKYMVRFAPESLGGYEDFITVETQGEDVLVVPIRAERHPPVLTCEFDLLPGTLF